RIDISRIHGPHGNGALAALSFDFAQDPERSRGVKGPPHEYVSALAGLRREPLVRLQREQPVAIADLDHALEILGLGELLAQQAVAQTAQLVAIQVADELVDQLRSRSPCGLHAVPTQLLQDLGAILERASRQAHPSRRRASRRASECSAA